MYIYIFIWKDKATQNMLGWFILSTSQLNPCNRNYNNKETKTVFYAAIIYSSNIQQNRSLQNLLEGHILINFEQSCNNLYATHYKQFFHFSYFFSSLAHDNWRLEPCLRGTEQNGPMGDHDSTTKPRIMKPSKECK